MPPAGAAIWYNFLSVAVCVSAYLSACPCRRLCMSNGLSVYMSVFVCQQLIGGLSVCLSASVYLYLYASICICLFAFVYLYVSVYIFVHLSVCICLLHVSASACLELCLSGLVCLSVGLSVYRSVNITTRFVCLWPVCLRVYDYVAKLLCAALTS